MRGRWASARQSRRSSIILNARPPLPAAVIYRVWAVDPPPRLTEPVEGPIAKL
jgi:hypothetical protein